MVEGRPENDVKKLMTMRHPIQWLSYVPGMHPTILVPKMGHEKRKLYKGRG